MSRAFIRFTGAVTMVLGSMLVLSTPAIAHEERHVGPYHFAVGFGDEPAYAGQKNSVQLILTDGSGKPVVDLANTLKVEVGYGPQRMNPLPMEPDFEVGESGIAGDYRGWFFPTRPGRYSFHFTGSIHGTSVDETFKSGPTTFSDVEDAQSVQFPAKDPTAGQLNELLGRQTQRLNQRIASVRSRASDDVASARNLASVGLALGIIAVGVSLYGLAKKR